MLYIKATLGVSKESVMLDVVVIVAVYDLHDRKAAMYNPTQIRYNFVEA
jgi:hypothetical protein